MMGYICVDSAAGFGGEMVWLLKARNFRRPCVLGVACTSVLVGVIIFDKFLSHSFNPPNQCPFPCGNASTYSSYARLQKNEATRTFKDSVVKRFDVVFLGSNSPIEDRFVVGLSKNLKVAMFAMIDGHKGTHCSQYLQENMLQHISSHLHSSTKDKDDLKVLLDLSSVESKQHHDMNEVAFSQGSDASHLPAETIKNSLKSSFINLDQKMSDVALEDVKAIISGHVMNDKMQQRILTALNGACALSALVRSNDIFIANTGDCRVVMGRIRANGKCVPIPLSIDQNARNPEEVKRLQAAHPGEDETTIISGRVLGSLMPFRSFGDVDYKWEKRYLNTIVPLVSYYYKTPPYITAEPILTHHKFQDGDKFLIIATDGFLGKGKQQESREFSI